MKTHDAAIQSGIGFHTATQDAAMIYDTSLDFLSSHCTHQELFQDIRNLMDKEFDKAASNWQQIWGRKVRPRFFTQVRVFDAHRVALIKVGMVTPNFVDAWVRITTVTDIYLSLTEDGMVTDIIKRPAVMNPANARPVACAKW